MIVVVVPDWVITWGLPVSEPVPPLKFASPE
jgi:hypothetical protein